MMKLFFALAMNVEGGLSTTCAPAQCRLVVADAASIVPLHVSRATLCVDATTYDNGWHCRGSSEASAR